jgi:hypothetical protein
MSSEGGRIQTGASVRGADGITETPRANSAGEELLDVCSRPLEASPWSMGAVWVALGSVLAAIAVGWTEGICSFEFPPALQTAQAGLVLLALTILIALCRGPRECSLVDFGLGAYAFGLGIYAFWFVLTDPMGYPPGEQRVLWSVAYLVPFVIGGVLLPARRLWLPGVACWCILFSGTLVLAYNTTNFDSRHGRGFFFHWCVCH